MQDATLLIFATVLLVCAAWVLKGAFDAAAVNRRAKADIYRLMVGDAVAMLPENSSEETAQDARAQLTRSYYGLCLFAAPSVVRACKRFLDAQAMGTGPQQAQETRRRLRELVLEMRRDLGFVRNLTPKSGRGLALDDVALNPARRAPAPPPTEKLSAEDVRSRRPDAPRLVPFETAAGLGATAQQLASALGNAFASPRPTPSSSAQTGPTPAEFTPAAPDAGPNASASPPPADGRSRWTAPFAENGPQPGPHFGLQFGRNDKPKQPAPPRRQPAVR